jgi:hypothetical protein
MEEYLGRVQALVWSLAELLSEDESGRVQHLVDHGEPAEAMRSLAWIIVNANMRVPVETIRAIRELSEGLVSPEHMPADLDAYALDPGP